MTTPHASAPVPVPEPLRERFVRAGSWTMLAHGGTLVLRLASSLVMTRLLAPDAFGLVALVATIGAVASLLSDIGIRQAVVHSEHGDSPRMLNTAWTMQIVRGLVIWWVCCLIALALHAAGEAGLFTGDSVYASPLLPPLLALGTLHTVIAGLETTKRYTADRRIDQKRVVLIELGAMAIGIALTIVLGWWTGSVWSIVIGGGFGALCSMLAGHRWLPGPANRLAWDPQFARRIFAFGKWILVSSLLYVLAMHGDKLLLGIWLTPAMLGCYAIALALAQVLELAVGRVFSHVAAPALGDVARSSPERLRTVFLDLRQPFDLGFAMAAGFLFACGPWLVSALYDPRYEQAGAMLQILSFGIVFARFGVSTSAWLALQAPQAQAVLNLVRLVAFFLLVPLAYHGFGATGALWAIALYPASMLPVVWWFDRRFGLFSARHEGLTLAGWPVGWAAGTTLVTATLGAAA